MTPRALLLIVPDFGVGVDGSRRGGGLQGFARMLARALTGFRELQALTLWSLLESTEALEAGLRPYLGAGNGQTPRVVLRGFGGARARLALAWLLRRVPAEHTQFLHIGVGRLAALRRGRPHSLWLIGIEVRRRLARAELRAVRASHPLLSISDFTAAEMRRHNPGLPQAVTVHLAAEDRLEEPPAAGRPSRGAPVRLPAVLIVARMAAAERYKGHDPLLDAWPLVRARQADAELWIVGSGDDAERLQRRAAALPAAVGTSVRFFGVLSDDELQQCYRTASVFAMPSTGEGFGIVFCEAMRHALPCIASLDAAAEVVVDGVTGFVVAQEPGPIAEACIALLQDPARAQQMGAAGLRRFDERFRFDAFVGRYRAAMGEVFAG
jgi:phosphatidylinositol alpha-1,6-mannosyltransferase